jgi:hypothetical protein
MLFLFWFLLVLAGSCLFLLVPALYGRTIYDRYRGVRAVICPQTHAPALVRFDALRAAMTGVFDHERLRLAACSLWPERMHCDQACIPDAAAFQWPVFRERTWAEQTGIHFLAVLGAAAAYWLINAAWYSHYLFRSAWMQLMGYSEEQVREMILLSIPQVFTAVWSLCFCCVLAWMITSYDRRGVVKGIEAGFLAWMPVLLAIVVVVVYRGLPTELVPIYASSTLIASLVAGAILGTWTRGRILHALGEE